MDRINKQTVLDFFSAAAASNTEKMLATFDPQVKIIEAESLPYGGLTEGRENFIAFTKRVFTTWKNTRVVVDELIADGDYVVVLAKMLGESKISGAAFEMDIAEVWKFDAKGKVIELKPFYFDTKRLLDFYQGDA